MPAVFTRNQLLNTLPTVTLPVTETEPLKVTPLLLLLLSFHFTANEAPASIKTVDPFGISLPLWQRLPTCPT
jgi:hypothetical protein